MSDMKKLFNDNCNRSKPAVSYEAHHDLRALKRPRQSFAGFPGQAFDGELVQHTANRLVPQHNPILKKLISPESIKIRVPDNSRVPTVNVNFNNYTILATAVSCPPTPYLLFLPTHNSGYFCVGSLITKGTVTKFVPSTTLPAARDMTSYSTSRNIASRVLVVGGTISTTNVALAGTINACAFSDLRNFITFNVSEFSTQCMSVRDYCQGVRNDLGVVLISGPEMIPDLRNLQTTALQDMGGSALILNNTFTFTTQLNQQAFTIYDYWSSSPLYGPIIPDRIITIDLSTPGTPTGTPVIANMQATVAVTYSTTDNAGALVDSVVNYNAVAAGNNMSNAVYFYLNISIPPTAPLVGWITKITVTLSSNAIWNNSIAATLTVPRQFDLGNLGPGFLVGCQGFSTNMDIVVNVTRSLEAVPASTLLPDVKVDFSGFAHADQMDMTSAIYAFNTPDSGMRRVYTKPDFHEMVINNRHPTLHSLISSFANSNFDAEDRSMAGPISGLIGALTPAVSMIPGIGPLLGGIGGILGQVTGGLGLSGPSPHGTSFAGPSVLDEGVTITEVFDSDCDQEDSELVALVGSDSEEEMQHKIRDLEQLFGKIGHLNDPEPGFAGPTLSDSRGMNVSELTYELGEGLTYEHYRSFSEVVEYINEQIGVLKVLKRYDLAMMGAPYLEDAFVAANLVGINQHGVASLEYLIISDEPVYSFENDENVATVYYEVIFSRLNWRAVFYLCEDFVGENGLSVDSALVVLSALVYSGRLAYRNTQYVTLPKRGLAHGPSLGLPALMACLGTGDMSSVFSGGCILTANDLKMSPISGTMTKAIEVAKNKMKLICTSDEAMTGVINEPVTRSDLTTATPYVSADAIAGGIPINKASAIVVGSTLEALAIGRTINANKQILNESPAESKEKNRKRIEVKKAQTERFEQELDSGLVPVPDSFMEVFGLRAAPTVEQFNSLDYVSVFEEAAGKLKTQNAQEGIRTTIASMVKKLEDDNVEGAQGALDSLSKLVLSQAKANTVSQEKRGGFKTLERHAAGLKRRAPAAAVMKGKQTEQGEAPEKRRYGIKPKHAGAPRATTLENVEMAEQGRPQPPLAKEKYGHPKVGGPIRGAITKHRAATPIKSSMFGSFKQ